MPELQDVFSLSGLPTVTFVEPTSYGRLKVALKTRGRGLVIEGPSGIGKTTSIHKAIEAIGMKGDAKVLTARRSRDRNFIESIPTGQDWGLVIIDDFHRLDMNLRRKIADYLKVLADEGDETTKLVLIGINKAGKSLVNFGRDLASRIEIIRLEREPDSHISKIILLGSKALNIKLKAAEDLVKAANGSFYLTQLLCHEACLAAKVYDSCGDRLEIGSTFKEINDVAVQRLGIEFDDIAVEFAKGGRLYREGRAPYLNLLRWLSESDEWAIDIDRLMARNPQLRGSVSQVIKRGSLKSLIENPEKSILDVLHFDTETNVLAIEDPKFYYYIRNLEWNSFARRVGFLGMQFNTLHDFALSFAGVDRELAESIFAELSHREFSVFYDFNEQADILSQGVEEYLTPIYESESIFVLCLLSSAYPTRIWTRIEGQAFKHRFAKGEVIPIRFTDAPPGMFDLSSEVGSLTYDPSKDLKTQVTDMCSLLSQKMRAHRVESST